MEGASIQHEQDVLVNGVESEKGNDKQHTTNFLSLGSTLVPCKNMTLDNIEDAKACYKAYARRVGFDIEVDHTRLSKTDKVLIGVDFACSRGGNPKQKDKEKVSSSKRHQSKLKIGCKAMMSVSLNRDTGIWAVLRLTTDHNHELYTPRTTSMLRGHRKLTSAHRSLIDVLNESGIAPRQIMYVLSHATGGEANVGRIFVSFRKFKKS